MQDTEVLWVDDDISTDGREIMKRLKDKVSGIRLLTAKTCGDSEKLLNSRSNPPNWAIVDLIVPQGGWVSNEYYSSPGIEYIKHLKTKYGNRIQVIAFSILVTQDIADQVKEAGAVAAFVKSDTSFAGILEEIKTGAGKGETIQPAGVRSGSNK
jgi:ActR/RegA family two-component response regulator